MGRLLDNGDRPTLSYTSTTDEAAVAIIVDEPASAALVRAVQRAEEYGRAAKAAATQTAYAGDWKRFCGWVEGMGATALPADPEIVAGYLAHLADEQYGISTIERVLSAVRFYHKQAGRDWYRGHPAVAATLEGIRRDIGTEHIGKTPIGLELLAALVDGLSLRDRALLTIGFFGSLRSANLVAIELGHVNFRPEGVVIHLPTSKTDQRKQGRDVAIHYQPNRSVCSVVALEAYLAASGITEGRIFPVSRRYVTRLVKRAVANPDHEHAGLREVEQCAECAARSRSFASHSLRRGFATSAAKDGVAGEAIMRQGGWKSERTMRGYIEYATPFENNATKDLAR